MPRQPQVRIVLDDCEDGGNTWVACVPIGHSYPNRSTGVARAAGEAAAMFIESILRDREFVAERLAAFEARSGD
jgi:hypothetical protein